MNSGEHRADPGATERVLRRLVIFFTLTALFSAGLATYFFATMGPIDPLQDAFFPLSIALDLLALFLIWRSVAHTRVRWLDPIWSKTRARLFRNRVAGIVVRVRVFPRETVSVLWNGLSWRFGVLVLGMVAYGVSLGLYVQQAPSRYVYAAWLTGLGAFLLAYAPERLPRPALSAREVLALLVLLGVGFGLRFYRLTTLPLQVHGDMASVGLQARAILRGDFPGWFALGWATIPMWGFAPEALTMRVFGDSLFGLRMSAVLGGMLSLLGVYMLGREGWSPRVGLFALAALAVDAAHIHFSRIPSYIDPVPWAVWALYFVVRGLKRRSPTAWALGGVCTAIAVNMYFSGRLLIPILTVFILYMFLFHTALLRQNKEGITAFVLGFLFTFGPMAVVVAQEFPTYMSRARFVMLTDPGVYQHLLSKYQAVSLREVLLEQVQRTFLTYQYYGDTSTQFGYPHPMLNPWLAPFFVIGAGVATGRLRHEGNFLLASWTLLGLVIGSVLTVDAPFWPRLVIILPANALLTALGMNWIVTILGERSRWRRKLLILIMVGILAGVGWQNWRVYAQEAGQRVGTNDFAARYMMNLGERPACYVRGQHSLSEREFRFLLRGRSDIEIDPVAWEEGARDCASVKGVVVALESERYLVEIIAATYPGGRLEEVQGPTGQPRLIIYHMP